MVKYYPIVDHIPGVFGKDHHDYRGKLTGEFRAPKKGEWFLSGNPAECYRMPNDGTVPQHIIKVVKLQTIITYIEVE